MKKLQVFVLIIFVGICLVLFGCEKKSFSYSRVYRDEYLTGGDLDFSYDECTHTAYFGGENQVVQYYEADIAKGWDEAGCRIGIKIYVPSNVKDCQSGQVKVNDKEYKDVLNKTEGYLQIFPLVSENEQEFKIKIIWEEGTQEQYYYIYFEKGTIFMEK